MINKSRVMYCSVFCFVLDTNQVWCLTPELYNKVNCTKSKRGLPLWGIPSCRYEWQYIFLCSRVWWCYRVSMHMVHYCEFHNTSDKIRKLLISNMSVIWRTRWIHKISSDVFAFYVFHSKISNLNTFPKIISRSNQVSSDTFHLPVCHTSMLIQHISRCRG